MPVLKDQDYKQKHKRMKIKWVIYCLLGLLPLQGFSDPATGLPLIFCGSTTNDLYKVLKEEHFEIRQYDSPAEAIASAPNGAAVLLVADQYPDVKNEISPSLIRSAKEKQLRLYIEYPGSLPGLDIPYTVIMTKLERGVVAADVFGNELKPMSILSINDCHIIPVKNVDSPLLVLGKVAGFDKAVYGLDDVKTYPLLFRKGNMLIATSKLSNFATGRYEPTAAWRNVWQYILSWLTGNEALQLHQWLSYVTPMYGEDESLPHDAKKIAVQKGVQWFYKAHLLVDPSWKAVWMKYQGDGTAPFGPPVDPSYRNGDGSLGILEGHASNIYYDGRQQYRYWMRADVQGEVAYSFAAAASFLHKKAYYKVAENLADFVFEHSNLRAGPKDDPKSAAYGLVGWAVTHPGVFYGDDNARFILGMIGAEAYMKTGKWDQKIAEAILANFRTTGKNGFRGDRLEQDDILKKGWSFFGQRDLVNPHPHFESWMWACYLWLYGKTHYRPLLEKTENAIRITMADYPDKWLWTNGIQQERARMVLPLAWLLRVDDTPEHRKWLDEVVSDLLKNQVPCGAIREELGAGNGMFGPVKSNEAYGSGEAPLIFKNGDPVADMLYTSNFAFFSLNEAAHATGNKEYADAVNKLGDFLTRIQVKSKQHADVDGAWFRAFDYKLWDYWASNADAGWGAWATLTGWIQSWIVTTEVLTAHNQSYWQLTQHSAINKQMPQTVKIMFGSEQ